MPSIYKEVFPLIQKNEVWIGYKSFGGGIDIISPKNLFNPSKVKKYTVDERENYIANIINVIWHTNSGYNKRHEELDLYKKYNLEEYPKYENFDAINVLK